MTEELDPWAGGRALRAPAPLAPFNAAGVLSAADIHVAATLLELAGLTPEATDFAAVALAAALAVRAPRLGHVYVDLAGVSDTVVAESPEAATADLDWPPPGGWRDALAGRAELVTDGEDAGDRAGLRPLRLIGTRLYLDRYWRQERALAERLLGLDAQPMLGPDLPLLAELLGGLFPDPRDSAQRAAAACAALRGRTGVAGGPGTGKTTTVARTVALLVELAERAGRPAPLIALCAPTGRAAARLARAVSDAGPDLDLSPGARRGLDAVRASTIHRLLGARGEGRFRHGPSNPLPHDVVIVDETSMVSLSLISHLFAAVRADARVVLVGDPDQLSAIEAGAVLRDIVGPAAQGPTFGAGMRSILGATTGTDPGPSSAAADFGSGVVVLRRGHRFGAPIGALADAIRRGDADSAITALRAGDQEVGWFDLDAAALGDSPDAAAELEAIVVTGFAPGLAAARAGDATEALAGLGELRLLCAHRLGRYGVRSWTLQVEAWLAQSAGLTAVGNYVGRPLLVSENDYELGLFNGDSGMIVASGAETAGPDEGLASFEHESGLLVVAPARLAAVETAYATTIHKSQGSQFATVIVTLPDADSRLLSRELLYTAVTRARDRVVLLGPETALRAAIARPVQRASGLADRLWRTSPQ